MYFFGWFVIAIVVYCFSFFVPQTRWNDQLSTNQIVKNESIQTYEFSSRDPQQAESFDDSQLYSYNITSDSTLSDQEIDFALKSETLSDDPYSRTVGDIEQTEEIYYDSFGSVLHSENFSLISSSDLQVDFETIDSCKKKPQRLVIENILSSKSSLEKLEGLQLNRDEVSELLPKRCVTQVMNAFNVSPRSLARCPKGSVGEPLRQGAKPCVTENLVNVTYNSFVDVAECMGFNPKDLIPKLSNESGMLINTLGAGYDAGIGQVTGVAIEEVNKYYDRYMKEIEEKAQTVPACQRILSHKKLLGKIGDDLRYRCGLISPVENPLRNILYMAFLNKRNFEVTESRIEENKVKQRLEQLGVKSPDMHMLTTMIALAGYNAGAGTSFNILDDYLDRRLKAKKMLQASDFDFSLQKKAKDIDGKDRLVTDIARAFVLSPFIKPNDPDKNIKLQRIKLLPEKMRTAHLLSFPEFMIYRQNNFDKTAFHPTNAQSLSQITDEKQKIEARKKFPAYSVIGAPGYLTFLANKNQALRSVFESSSEGADYCSNPRFLKISN